MPPSKVELYAAIRRDARAGMSGRAIEKKYRVGRRTIVKALSSAWPEPRKQLPPRASRLDPFKPVIDEVLQRQLFRYLLDSGTAVVVTTHSPHIAAVARLASLVLLRAGADGGTVAATTAHTGLSAVQRAAGQRRGYHHEDGADTR